MGTLCSTWNVELGICTLEWVCRSFSLVIPIGKSNRRLTGAKCAALRRVAKYMPCPPAVAGVYLPRGKFQLLFPVRCRCRPPRSGLLAPFWCHYRQGLHVVCFQALTQSDTTISRRPRPSSRRRFRMTRPPVSLGGFSLSRIILNTVPR